MRICFIISFTILTIGFLAKWKTNSYISFMKEAIISIWIEICLGIAFAGMMKVLSLDIGIKSMTWMYGILAVLLWGYIVYEGKRQLYYINMFELVGVMCCIVLFLFVFIKTFGIDIHLAYHNSDPAVHMTDAMNIVYTHRIGHMYFAALFNALIMELLQPFLVQASMYKAFILGDALLNLFNLLIFWVLVEEKTGNRIVAIVALPIYFLGWPCWSWIKGGYVYFGVGVTNYMVIIYCLTQLFDEPDSLFKKRRYIFYLALLCYCLIESYMIFVPGVVASLVVIILLYCRKRINIKKIIYTLLCVGLLGILLGYIIFEGYMGGHWSFLNNLKIDGGIYKSTYKEFIIIMPLAAFEFMNEIKARKVTASMISTCVFLLITIAALILCINKYISSYYYFKLYYPLYTMLLIEASVCLVHIFYNRKDVCFFVLMSATCLIVIDRLNLDNRVWGKEDYPIFGLHSESINAINTYYDDGEQEKESVIALAQFINENLPDEEIILYTDWDIASVWYTPLTWKRYVLYENGLEKWKMCDLRKSIMNNKNCYIALNQNEKWYQENTDYWSQYECIYNNGYYGIYRIK